MTQKQLSRFEGEGLLKTSYVKGEGFIVQNPKDFVDRVMTPRPEIWPPTSPSLDDALQDEYARVQGPRALAEKILAPFRFQSMGDKWDDIVDLARPSIRLVKGGDAGVGGSRIGGVPDASSDFEWPQYEDAPLGFVGQINLKQLQGEYPNSRLPARGVLSFFYDALQEAWGFDPRDKGRWAVVHMDGDLHPASVPVAHPDEGRYAPVHLKPVGELTLPEPDSLEIERLELDKTQRWAYGVLCGELEEARQTRGPIHRLLGWPEQVQHDPAREVQLPANGVYSGSGAAYSTDRGKQLMQARDLWQLLLQVDTDSAAGMMWGDVGRIYYMATKQDLAAQDWGACWFTFQCG